MEEFKVPRKIALPGLTAEPHRPPPGRSPEPTPAQKPPEKPKGNRLKQLFNRGAKGDDAGPSEAPTGRPRLDAATVIDTLGVPGPLRGDTGCYALLAGSLAAAYNALRDLSDEPIWGGKNADGGTAPPPPTPRYHVASFMPSSLSYQRLPLLPRHEWHPFLRALLFSGERQARDLAERGFDHALAKIWKGAGDGAKPSKGSAASGGPLDDMIDRIWKQIYSQPDRWRGKALPQIANAIYIHGYLGLDQQPPSGKQKASAADVHYWKSLPEAMNVSGRQQGDEFDPGEFYYLGDKVQSTYRIYVHANHAVVHAVLGTVQDVMNEQKLSWCAKIASPVEAKFRPDTVVIYVTEPDRERVDELARTLADKIDTHSRRNSVPPLTTEIARGISTAWDPECVDKDHSFGSFHAGILAEAFYDVVANMAAPTRSVFATTARGFLGMYGVDAARPGKRPDTLPESAPTNMAKFAGEDDSNAAALHELAQRPSDRTPPATAPAQNQRLRVHVMPTRASDVANAKQNLKRNTPPVNTPHNT